ncbi:hypothetical protein PGT21_011891 [Puccinia graminis f. sp. tritici]|uniref:Retrotransposon gag domain-containing protein n=1 Tax=Puccinia graminis f. sp. tritici TaxID=56615 RepID=A0A5B0MLE1_PUCGR|nr:hypothetical protein PGT21_011891 [Puccinia graminis f. sp. tritici]
MATSLETLIGIIKATEPAPQPARQPLNFDPVSTVASAENPNRSQFAFVGFTAPPQTQHSQQAEASQANQMVPRPFPSHENPAGEANPVYLEPPKLPEVWFLGETKLLAPFLRSIRDFLYPRHVFFSSQSRMIVWISRHFGFRPLEPKNGPCSVENWYNALILSNARAQGENNPYADLDRLPFIHPMLQLVTEFEKGLIDTFGDKFQLDSAKKALAACKQGKMSVEEYNAQYSTLCYQVVNSEDAQIDKYVEGLNFDIISQAMSTDWLAEPTLAGKMARALDASQQLAALSKIPNKHSSTSVSSTPAPRPPPFVSPSVYQHPNSAVRAPDAMDIDAVELPGGIR